VALLAGPASAAPPAGWPDVQGRWTVESLPGGANRALPFEAIEIAPCDGTLLCGRPVQEGRCDPAVLRLATISNKTLIGTSTTNGVERPALLWRNGERLVVEVVPPAARPAERHLLNLIASFRRDGPSRCDPRK